MSLLDLNKQLNNITQNISDKRKAALETFSSSKMTGVDSVPKPGGRLF